MPLVLFGVMGQLKFCNWQKQFHVAAIAGRRQFFHTTRWLAPVAALGETGHPKALADAVQRLGTGDFAVLCRRPLNSFTCGDSLRSGGTSSGLSLASHGTCACSRDMSAYLFVWSHEMHNSGSAGSPKMDHCMLLMEKFPGRYGR